MKIILYMAISANGYIAKENNETPWSEEEWKSFLKKVKQVGNIIIGRVTYESMLKDNSFSEMGDPLVIVLTSGRNKPLLKKTVFVTSFKEAILETRRRKFKEVLVAGGCKTDTSALESGLIDEFYLDVEPFIFGKGISLFYSVNKMLNLKLLGTKKIGNNGIQLHYEVIK